MVMEVVQEDMGDEEDNMQCVNHPYKNSSPGGICAFCLQEKLGNLVSSSFPVAVFPSSSSSSTPPSFRSETNIIQLRPNTSSSTTNQTIQYYSRRSRIPFLLIQRKKTTNVFMADSDQTNIVFKRSKSTVVDYAGDQKRGFWSFLYLKRDSSTKKTERLQEKEKEQSMVVVDESSDQADRKVSRSRSVGCGSRSFSGDFFDRISTGLGDCTLRRVESQREDGKQKVNAVDGGGGQDCIKERVKCGGIFSGFMISSSSSSSSSCSTEDVGHGKSKSWGWALASPIRAFSKHGKQQRHRNGTPNLAAVPSLLAVRP